MRVDTLPVLSRLTPLVCLATAPQVCGSGISLGQEWLSVTAGRSQAVPLRTLARAAQTAHLKSQHSLKE
jgi:hypothetical protein